MSVTLDEFLPDVLPEVPGCPSAMARHAVRRSIRRLCASGLWNELLPPISTIAGVGDYDVVAIGDREVERVSLVFYDGMELEHMPIERARYHQGIDWRTKTAVTPSAYTMTDPRTLYLVPAPSDAKTDVIEVRADLKPTNDANAVPEFFLQDWPEAVAAGALTRLLMQRKQPWADPQMASVYERAFNSAVASAGVQVARGHSDAPIRTVGYS